MLSDSPFLSEREAAFWLHVKPQTLSNWRHQGRGPAFVKLGSRVVYSKAALEAFIAANTRTSTSAQAARA